MPDDADPESKLGREIQSLRRANFMSQEELAERAGIKLGTLQKIEAGKSRARSHTLHKIADALCVDPRKLITLSQSSHVAPASQPLILDLDSTRNSSNIKRTGILAHSQPRSVLRSPDFFGVSAIKRREFLQLMSFAGSALAVPINLMDWERVDDALNKPTRLYPNVISDLQLINQSYWEAYRAVREKRTLLSNILSHLQQLVNMLPRIRNESGYKELCVLIADLTQLSGEIFFDASYYTEAASCYSVATKAASEANAYDLWACAQIRSSFISIYDGQYGQSLALLQAAKALADRGSTELATRHWAASVTAEVYAWLGAEKECFNALDFAHHSGDLSKPSAENGAWLRFNNSRISETHGSCLLRLGRFNASEQVLESALDNQSLSHRRRGIILADLALVSVSRGDINRACQLANEVISIADGGSVGLLSKKLMPLSHKLQLWEAHNNARAIAARINELGGE